MRAIFVMIKCDMGQAYKVAREAADSIEQMSELYSTSGQYDLLGKFYLDPDEDIGRFVTEKVQALPGVKDTYTLITFNAFTGGGDRRAEKRSAFRQLSTIGWSLDGGRRYAFPPYRRAIMSISTSAPRASPVTPMQVRAGSRSGGK